jgi:hypothetical protein
MLQQFWACNMTHNFAQCVGLKSGGHTIPTREPDCCHSNSTVPLSPCWNTSVRCRDGTQPASRRTKRSCTRCGGVHGTDAWYLAPPINNTFLTKSDCTAECTAPIVVHSEHWHCDNPLGGANQCSRFNVSFNNTNSSLGFRSREHCMTQCPWRPSPPGTPHVTVVGIIEGAAALAVAMALGVAVFLVRRNRRRGALDKDAWLPLSPDAPSITHRDSDLRGKSPVTASDRQARAAAAAAAMARGEIPGMLNANDATLLAPLLAGGAGTPHSAAGDLVRRALKQACLPIYLCVCITCEWFCLTAFLAPPTPPPFRLC